MAGAGTPTASVNTKMLTVEFNGDFVASCRLIVSRSSGTASEIAMGGNTDITTCR
jgi:hypothetical protein